MNIRGVKLCRASKSICQALKLNRQASKSISRAASWSEKPSMAIRLASTLERKDAIHLNPVRGKRNLAEDFTKYPHSNSSYYELGEKNKYVTHNKNI